MAESDLSDSTREGIERLAAKIDSLYADVPAEADTDSFEGAVNTVAELAAIHVREEVQLRKWEALEQARQRREKSAQYEQLQQEQQHSGETTPERDETPGEETPESVF
jgi:serine phosphatase RsbU (regulator of sigma subunit)